MRSFLKFFLASLVALIVFTGLSIVLIVGLVSLVSTRGTVEIQPRSVLVLDLSDNFPERRQEDPYVEFTGNTDLVKPSLYEVLRAVKYAAKDSSIRGIYLKCANNSNGFAASEELRRALLEFKKSGKFILAYGDAISQKAYYVANMADRVYCNPKGGVDWQGYSSQFFFLKNALARLEIEPMIFYDGKFKSATEPLREEKMTEPNRLQTREWLGDLYSLLLESTAAARNIDSGTLRRYANEFTIKTAYDAFKYKLVDGLKYDDEVKTEIRQLLGITEKQPIRFVQFGTYLEAVSLTDFSSSNRIAVVHAEGEIVTGNGERGQVGSDQYRALIHQLVNDQSVKAIVLRVNSPGGSSYASEVIWRELSLARKNKKPLIVSMGDVAASGGYYIATPADSIFVGKGTITGSIGVFGVIPNLEKFLKNKLGVTVDGVKTGPYADLGSPFRPMTETERRIIQSAVDSIYLDFKIRVAEGRRKDTAYIDSIAQGRVWTGQRAVALGLADRIGNLDDAVQAAVRMAGLKDYYVREYPQPSSFFDLLMSSYRKNVRNSFLEEELSAEELRLYKQLRRLKQMSGEVQARLPYEFEVN